jgi:hypothetical protein
MLERLNPRAASVRTDKGGTARPFRLSTSYDSVPYYVNTARKITEKLSEKALGKSIIPKRTPLPRSPEYWRAVVASVQGENGSRPSELRSASLYNPAKLNDLFRCAVQPGFKDGAMLGRVVTVELLLRAADADIA